MELYDKTSYELAELLTKRYSTSFSMSSRLFGAVIRPHIYAIYGMVRLADEIVDSYAQADTRERLEEFHAEVLDALATGYSVNPIVHAFVQTARQYGISSELIDPFFASMVMDTASQQFDEVLYRQYIYGSAEVVGLMCLKVFVGGDDAKYAELLDGARALGSAYQKVNFLRDIKADHELLGRMYFPGMSYESFTDLTKAQIISDIETDFVEAALVIPKLPASSQKAVRASYYYYRALLNELKHASTETITSRRLSVAKWRKLALLVKAVL